MLGTSVFLPRATSLARLKHLEGALQGSVPETLVAADESLVFWGLHLPLLS